MAVINSAAPTALDDLTAVAIDLPPGSAVLCEGPGRHHVLDPVDHFYGPLVGLSCPFEVAAVGSVADCVVWYGDCPVPVVVAWAANRLGQATMGVRVGSDPDFATGKLSDCPGLDVARRALGMATPVCREPTVRMADAVFFHRALCALGQQPGDGPEAEPKRRPSDSPAGRAEPEQISGVGLAPTELDPTNGTEAQAELGMGLNWSELAALHPLAEGDSVTPVELLERRVGFETTHTWSSLRRAASLQGPNEPLVAPGLTPAVAAWLDDGSFARWVLAGLGDINAAQAGVTAALDPPAAAALHQALAAP